MCSELMPAILPPQEAQSIEDRLRREMLEIFYSRNVE
jgi:S-adenosylmethionine decarboxylase